MSPVVANLPWFDHGAAPRGIAVDGARELSPLVSAAEQHMDITPFCRAGTGRLLHILAKAHRKKEILRNLRNWSQRGYIFRKRYEKYTEETYYAHDELVQAPPA